MATRKKKTKEIEVKEPIEVKKKKIPTKEYTVLQPWMVSGKLLKKGDKISLTEEGYKFYKKQLKVK